MKIFRFRHYDLLSVTLIIALLLSVAAVLSSCGKKEPDPEPVQEETIYGDESLGIDPVVDETLRDYRSIALLGIDAGSRSDVILVVTLNKTTNEAKVAAVHRDTYMQIAENGTYRIDGKEREFFKCNRAYKRDGIYGAMKELNRHMDLNIKECIAIDWDGISHIIDSFGGIDVDVTEGMIGLMNRGLDDNEKITHSGVQTLNGKQAVLYLRCRKDPGSDATTRDARNQAVFSGLFERAKTMSLGELSDVYESVAYQIETNMSRNTLTDTLATIASVKLEETPGWPYEYSNMWQDDDSYYYFVPDTLTSNVTELHSTLFGQENYEPTETVKTLNDKIETARKEQLH